MNTKRNSIGVVDAITAQDVGKFPDSNLAESLQRIAGVSINRRDGEGGDVTVRGFGAEYNLITLNGRTMPGGRMYNNSQEATRSFDFANLASEGISAIQVYKTNRADIASGGIGATVDVHTARPLENPGFRASIGAKAVVDTTNRTGDDITPELSGLVNWTDESNTFGVSLAGSLQERDSGSSSASVNDWRIQPWVPQGEPGAMSIGAGPNGESDAAYKNSRITNAPAVGQLYGLPNDLRYHFSDNERSRKNAQLTLQFRPMDNFTATLDYFLAENELMEKRGDKAAWMTRTTDQVEFDSGNQIATPLFISEVTGGTKDNGFEQQHREQQNSLDSIGLNLAWNFSDQLSFGLDAHSSTMESSPNSSFGGSALTVSVATPVSAYQTHGFNTSLPTLNYQIDDSIKGNGNGVEDLGDIGSQVMRIFYSRQETQVDQIRLNGSWEFDNGRFDFGVESNVLDMNQQYSENYMALGDWGVTQPMDVPVGLMENFDVVGEFDDFNTANTSHVGFKSPDPIALGQWAAQEYGHDFTYNSDFSQNHAVEEDTNAIFFQVQTMGELGDMPFDFRAGLRFEETEVTAVSYLLLPTEINWLDNNDYLISRASIASPYTESAKYRNLLPSMDFGLNLTDDLKARFSFSQTMARASYTDLRSAVTVGNPSGPTLTGIQATATASNPSLVPLESTNYDMSLEWYYDEDNYVSAGYYEKHVQNFIGKEKVSESQFGLRDATAGPRALAAQDAIAARSDHDGVVDETELFVMTAILDNPGDFPGGAADYVPGITFAEGIAAAYDVVPNSTDPLYSFLTERPVNNKEARIYGFEFAVQHWFGETGFGVQANYTTVNGDVGFDDNAAPGTSQFALLGLSDTANIVGLYEKNGLQARISYNWRDLYLAETSRGSYQNPRYVDEYEQIDVKLAYYFNDNLNVFFEGLNVTGEDTRSFGRSELQMWDLFDYGARYHFGVQHTF